VIGSGYEDYQRVSSGTLRLFGAIAIVSLVFKLDLARGYLAIALPAGLMMLILRRWMWRRVEALKRSRGEF
ncbi:sugar transferase, partial [Rhodococcus ruber]|nr:sugar transferase [Rhodococcus ruber]